MRVTLLFLLLSCAPAGAGELHVTSTSPAAHDLAAAATTSIAIDLDRPVDIASVPGSVRVRGRWTGPALGVFAFENGDRRIRFTPAAPFSGGEEVYVDVSRNLLAADGASLDDAGFAFSFHVAAGRATMDFQVIDTMEVATEDEGFIRVYGGQASDLDRDGWLDISVISEVTGDVRVFLNTADGSGLLEPYLEPAGPLGDTPSPNESADFNGDGLDDIVIGNQLSASVSVLLGNGDGTFQPPDEFTTGAGVYGVAVLDADGDGDTDIASTCRGLSQYAVLLNDGTGQFGAATLYEAGISAEYSMGAADMNGDGRRDLIVGSITTGEVIVMLGQGDGTFLPQDPTDAGGTVWMLVPGDVNGDGHVDIATANGISHTCSILLGDGTGALALDVTYPTGETVIATDLGDLDGDGDLDWVTSCFVASYWEVWENDGCGAFTSLATLPAPSNPACCIMFDADNDQDLDLALLDEIADVLILRRNDSLPGDPADLDYDGSVTIDDLLLVLGSWGACPEACDAACPGDTNGDGTVGINDLLAILAAWR